MKESDIFLRSIYKQTRTDEDLLSYYRTSLAKRPTDPDIHCAIAQWLLRKDRYEGALRSLQRSLEFDPDHHGATIALAWIYATCPDKQYRDGRRAILLARRAFDQGVNQGARETEWKIRNYLTLLAVAHAEAGEWCQAVLHQREAIRCTNTVSHLPELQNNLDRYLRSQSVRELIRRSQSSANDA